MSRGERLKSPKGLSRLWILGNETKTFKEADIYDRVHETKKGHSKASVKLLRCYNEDIEKIKDIMKEELVVVNDIQVPEKVFK